MLIFKDLKRENFQCNQMYTGYKITNKNVWKERFSIRKPRKCIAAIVASTLLLKVLKSNFC